MLLYELMSRELPFANVSPAQVVMGVITNLMPRPRLPNPDEWPESLRALMELHPRLVVDSLAPSHGAPDRYRSPLVS